MELEECFKNLGFNTRESKILSLLLTVNESTAKDISIKTGIKTHHVYEIIERLLEKGIIIKKQGRPARYLVNPDIETFRELARDYIEEINKALNKLEMALKLKNLPSHATLFFKSQKLLVKIIRKHTLNSSIIQAYIPSFKYLGEDYINLLDKQSNYCDLKVATSDKDIIRRYLVTPPYIRYVEVTFPFLLLIFNDTTVIFSVILLDDIITSLYSTNPKLIRELSTVFNHIWTDDYLRTMYKLRITSTKEY